MQEPDHVVAANPPGRGLRRGKRLPPIQTTFTPDPIRNVQRPPPVETIIYKTSPERPMPPTAPPAANRRGFLGLFSRSKSVKDLQPDYRSALAEGDDGRRRKSSHSSGMSGSKSLESKPKKSASTRKERPQRSVMTWDPPPLFQAYSQSVKYSTLPMPTISADHILKVDKQFQSRQKADTSVLDSISNGAALPFEEGGHDETHKRLKKGTHTSDTLSWTTKVFVLTVSGFLLQYSGSGHHDRLPEKIMQLTSDSAAFASDAIPGKHWVLQVTSSLRQEATSTAPASKSMFSKLSSRQETKRIVNNFLLVMESPEDMNSWLVAVRKEIQALGGQSYRPDEVARKDPAEVIQQLQQKPSRRFLIQRNPDPEADPGELSPKGFASQREMPLADRHESPASATRPFLQHTQTNTSEASEATIRPPLSGHKLEANFQEPFNVKTNLKEAPTASPPSNAAPTSLLKWELPANFTPSFSNTSIGLISNEFDARRESMSSVPSLSSQGRSHRSLSEQSDSQAPNFSLPTFSNRFSHSTKSATVTTPPTSSGSAFRDASSVSQLEETPSKRNMSFVGDVPTIVKHTSWSKHSEVSEINEEITDESNEWEDVEDLQPLPTRIFKSSHPKRLSSLGNRYSLFPQQSPESTPMKQQNSPQSEPLSPRRHSSMDIPPKNASRKSQRLSYLPPQHPPPTGALPAIPSSSPANVDVRPSTSPKLRRPTSMQIRPTSRPTTTNFNTSLSSANSASPMSLRERRSFMGRPPSHMLGPPAVPPPSNPLPDIPPVRPTNQPADHWPGPSSKAELVNG